MADKLLELFEFTLRLAWIAYNEGGAYGGIGQLGAEPFEQAQGALAVDAALHRVEDARVDVLQRDVDVVADVLVAGDGVDGVFGEGGWVGVVEAYPGGAALSGQAVEQLAQGAVAVEVEAIPGGVLADDYQLLDASGDECLGLVDNLLDGT